MTMRLDKRRPIMQVIIAAWLSLTLTACSGGEVKPDITPSSPSRDMNESIAPVARLPRSSLAAPPALRLDKGVIPPTNHWFSGLVFPERAQTVFPSPLAYTPLDDGFAVGVPVISSTPSTIAGGAVKDVTVGLESNSFAVSGYEDASVTVNMTNEGQRIASVTLAEGSPVVSIRGLASSSMTMHSSDWEETEYGWVAHSASGRDYVVDAKQAETTLINEDLNLALNDQSSVTIIAVPDGISDSQLRSLSQAAAITGVHLAYRLDGDRAISTLEYDTQGGSSTIVAAAPHQQGACGNPIGTYPSVYGTLHACSATTLVWAAPLITENSTLSLDHLSAEDKTYLINLIKTDTRTNLNNYADDTYTGGKDLQRNAALMILASQLGQQQEADQLRDSLSEQITQWATADGCSSLQSRCFFFDDQQHLVIGKQVAYGSETANDTHFHLGYFLSAAAMVAANDTALASTIAPVMNALAENLASNATSDTGPRMRTFDPYWSHSWASGWSPFADGNNQESSSEAINAWNGLALWAKVTDNATLLTRAQWMLSNEVASSKAYWTNFDTSDAAYDGFDHSIVSLNWGGKRDYSTWFSPDPSAKLGILILPASPVSVYLGGDGQRIRRNVDEAIGNHSDYNVMFGDYMLMYRSLAGTTDARSALALARELPDARIDNGNTRSYMTAFIMSMASG